MVLATIYWSVRKSNLLAVTLEGLGDLRRSPVYNECLKVIESSIRGANDGSLLFR